MIDDASYDEDIVRTSLVPQRYRYILHHRLKNDRAFLQIETFNSIPQCSSNQYSHTKYLKSVDKSGICAGAAAPSG